MTAAPRMADARAQETPDLTGLAGLKLGNYRLERLVGRGRMGAVYLANDEALLRPTAIKILAWKASEAHGHDPVQWFLAEARLVARINHPRVVQIYGAARHGEHCYIAMEYVAGSSAEALVAEGGPMAPDAATHVLLQAASALHAAHRAGVVHRDVKPANLLVGAGGITKLGDFGMALGLVELHTAGAHLRVGTPYYIAPEIWRGEAATASCDIYSLGATYFHLLTGRPPFPQREVAAVEQAHLRAPIPDPRELVPALPASCAALVRRALAKSPRERHATAQELLWDGRRVLHELAAAPDRAPARSPRSRPGAPGAGERAAVAAAPAGPLRSLGFARAPFGDVDASAPAYGGEPFASARARLLEALADEACPVVALAGAPGSGRSTLARRLAAELAAERDVTAADLALDAAGAPLLQQLCRGAGAVEHSSDDDALDALVAVLGEDPRRRPLVVVDGVALPLAPASPLAALARAARWTRAFQLLLVGAPGCAQAPALAPADGEGPPAVEVALPPLGREDVARYVASSVAAALETGAPPILFSPDALLLLARRSAGDLARVQRLARDMLLLAAADGARTLTSWHAWAAAEGERRAAPQRPATWPSAEALEALDACRREAGLPPWPRPREAPAGRSPS